MFKDYVYTDKDADVIRVLEPSTNNYSSLVYFITEIREQYPDGRYLLVGVPVYRVEKK